MGINMERFLVLQPHLSGEIFDVLPLACVDTGKVRQVVETESGGF